MDGLLQNYKMDGLLQKWIVTKFGIFEPEWTVLYGAVTKGQCQDSPRYYEPDTQTLS